MRAVETEALESRRGENGCIAFAGVELAEPRFDVAAQNDDLDVGSLVAELALPPLARRADARASRQRGDRFMTRGNESIARVAALERGADREPRREFARHVLHRVHRDLGVPGPQGLLELLDEEALAARVRKASLDPVALRDDRHEADDEAGVGSRQARGHVFGLPEGKPAPSRRDADLPGHRSILPCRVKRLGFDP